MWEKGKENERTEKTKHGCKQKQQTQKNKNNKSQNNTKNKNTKNKNKTTPHSINLHILRNQCKMDLKFSLFGVSECSIFFCLGCFIFLYNCFEALKKRSSFCLRPCKKNVRWFWRLFKTVANFGFFFWRMCWASCPGPGPPPKNGQKNDPVSKCYRLKKSGGWTFDEQSFDFNEISNLCFRTSEHGYRKSLWSGRARLAHMFKI